MTKRQVLNALLEVKEKKDKLYESQKRLWSREEKLDESHADLADKLSNIDYDERLKAGGINQQPIVFKGCVFNVIGKRSYSLAECDITKVSSVS